ATAGATAEARQRHADYYFALVQRAADPGRAPATGRWHDHIEAEYVNIRAAWQWALDAERWGALWPLVFPLFSFWMYRGYWSDGLDLLLLAVRRAPPDDASGYALALVALATLLARTGRLAEALPYGDEGYRRALIAGEPNTIGMTEMHRGLMVADVAARERHFQAALAACRQANNRPLLANALMLYGDFLREQGALELAHARYSESLALARALGDDELALYPLGNLGRLALLDGAIGRAQSLFAECVAMARAQIAPVALVDWLLRLGVVQVYQREPAAAHATLTECVVLAEEINHWRCLPNARVWMAVATLERGDTTAANQVLQQAMAEYASRLGSPAPAHPYPAELVEALVAAAYIYAAQQRFEEAAVMLGCAEALGAQPQAPADPFLAALANQVREQLARAMGPAALQQALARGQATEARAHLAPTLAAPT
ncbi:MAG: tetratricopeptide repeat protein, partial [Chloroflexales bacterium]|nr:tetratricopeptide repeat protein [Chloroflexales bacterium]